MLVVDSLSHSSSSVVQLIEDMLFAREVRNNECSCGVGDKAMGQVDLGNTRTSQRRGQPQTRAGLSARKQRVHVDRARTEVQWRKRNTLQAGSREVVTPAYEGRGPEGRPWPYQMDCELAMAFSCWFWVGTGSCLPACGVCCAGTYCGAHGVCRCDGARVTTGRAVRCCTVGSQGTPVAIDAQEMRRKQGGCHRPQWPAVRVPRATLPGQARPRCHSTGGVRGPASLASSCSEGMATACPQTQCPRKTCGTRWRLCSRHRCHRQARLRHFPCHAARVGSQQQNHQVPQSLVALSALV